MREALGCIVRVDGEQQTAELADETEGIQNDKRVVSQEFEEGRGGAEQLRNVHAHNVTKMQSRKAL